MYGGAWWTPVHGVAKSRARLSDFTFTFHFPALEKEMATHSCVLAWRIPGTGEPSGLPSMGLHRVGHDWRDLAAAAVPSETAGTQWEKSPAWILDSVPTLLGDARDYFTLRSSVSSNKMVLSSFEILWLVYILPSSNGKWLMLFSNSEKNIKTLVTTIQNLITLIFTHHMAPRNIGDLVTVTTSF